MSNWRFVLFGYIFIQHDSAEVVIRIFYSRKLSSLNMDDSSQDQYISLQDIFMTVYSQEDDNTRLRQDISNLRQEVHGACLSVSSQVKKLKTDSQYTWKYEGNKVHYHPSLPLYLPADSISKTRIKVRVS